jgi:hypothetical protein
MQPSTLQGCRGWGAGEGTGAGEGGMWVWGMGGIIQVTPVAMKLYETDAF